MDRVLISSYDIKFKSAFRNLKSAILLGAMLFALCVSAEAQQATKTPRIGYLSGSFTKAGGFGGEAFRQGLRELGYIEGKNILIDYALAEEKLDRLLVIVA